MSRVLHITQEVLMERERGGATHTSDLGFGVWEHRVLHGYKNVLSGCQDHNKIEINRRIMLLNYER